MYLQAVLFKPSWILASERDVCLMDAFFYSPYIFVRIFCIVAYGIPIKFSLYFERLIQNCKESIDLLDRIVVNQRNANYGFIHIHFGFESVDQDVCITVAIANANLHVSHEMRDVA